VELLIYEGSCLWLHTVASQVVKLGLTRTSENAMFTDSF